MITGWGNRVETEDRLVRNLQIARYKARLQVIAVELYLILGVQQLLQEVLVLAEGVAGGPLDWRLKVFKY